MEVTIKSKKIIIGGIYRPPESNSDYFNLILESIDRACSTNIHDIIITGDFNFDMLLDRNNKMKDLLLEFNLTQLIAEPTHFTEKPSISLIDLIIARNRNNILASGVADPIFPNLKRYHCPIFVLLKFIRPKTTTYKRKIWNYQRADFVKFSSYESTYHFFFQCPNYSQIRNRYLPNNLNDLNTNDLLHGKSNLTETENETLFSKVQDFILNSGRFA